MRIFLLPISTRRAFIYCQRRNQKPTAELSYADRVTKRVAVTWAKWEAAESGWQKKVTEYGNRGLQRIPYQEWGLKSFPPLNPQVQAEELAENKKFEVLYPRNIIQYSDVPKIMGRLASERKQLHWSRFTWSMIGLPFTIPFGLIPVYGWPLNVVGKIMADYGVRMPNIPFFYLAFRCWSHWRALKGSDHLDFIIDHRLFKAIPSPDLEEVYNETAPGMQDSFTFVTASQVVEGTDPEERMLLNQSSPKLVAQSLQVPELSVEVERAVRQVEGSLRREKTLEYEKQRLEASAAPREEQQKPKE